MTRTRSVAAAALAVAALLVATAAGLAATHADGRSTYPAARSTAAFHSLAAAKRAGYALLKDAHGVACIAMDSMPGMGAMGVHFAKGALVGDGTLRVSTPEALVYAPTRSGALQLAAVEYVVTKAAWDAKHASPPSLFGRRLDFTPAGNRFGLPAFYSLHAWIWKHNPAGTFSMWNPEVSCR